MTKFVEVTITYCFWLAWIASGFYTFHYAPNILGQFDNIAQKVLILELTPILALFVFIIFLFLVKQFERNNKGKIFFPLSSDLIWSQQLTEITKNTKLLDVEFLSGGLYCHITPSLYNFEQKKLYSFDKNIL